MKTTAVILAAGQGTRMRSKLPKILHPLAGKPMVSYTLEATTRVTGEKPVLVIGHGAEQTQQVVGEAASYVVQENQLGTGHAVMQAESVLSGKTDLVLVLYADMPLVRAETLQRLVEAQVQNSGPVTLLTVIADDPHGFGRVLRGPGGEVLAVVEEAQATAEQKKITELNAGFYCFRADWLWQALKRIQISPKGEYYLTDIVEIAVQDGYRVQARVIEDRTELIGINNRLHLAEAEAVMRYRINTEWMLRGVTIIDPQTTYIEPGVTIGQDTVIWPNTYLQGNTTIGEECTIGPNSLLRDTRVGSQCKVFSSVLEKAVLEDHVDMGPFGHLRKGAHLADGVHMGHFGEVKNSYLGPGTKMGHFSYIGDATIGTEVNIGAGTITCNFDGSKKNHTDIGPNVFIGSDTMLVAPVSLGEGARTGAGAVVTKDVPSHTLVVGVPARPLRKLEKLD